MSIQKSRKIWDAADHAQPVCKRGKISCSLNPPQTMLAAAASDFNGFDEAHVGVHLLPLWQEEDRKSRRHAEFCANCYSDKKGALLRCRDCRRSGKTVMLPLQ